MVISRASADAPKTFAGPTVSYDHDSTYQEKKIIRSANVPIEYATSLVRLVPTGTEQAGLQEYTSP